MSHFKWNQWICGNGWIRFFHKHTLALLPPLHFLKYLQFSSLFAVTDVNVKLEIKWKMGIIFQDYTLHWSGQFVISGRAETKLAMLASLYCEEFSKNSYQGWIDEWNMNVLHSLLPACHCDEKVGFIFQIDYWAFWTGPQTVWIHKRASIFNMSH